MHYPDSIHPPLHPHCAPLPACSQHLLHRPTLCPQAFTSLLGLKLSRPEDLDPDTLRDPPFPRYTPLGSTLSVQQLRPYFLNRTYTDTDVGCTARGR